MTEKRFSRVYCCRITTIHDRCEQIFVGTRILKICVNNLLFESNKHENTFQGTRISMVFKTREIFYLFFSKTFVKYLLHDKYRDHRNWFNVFKD